MKIVTQYEEIAVYLDQQGESHMADTLRRLIESERAARNQSRKNLDAYYAEKAKHEPPQYRPPNYRAPAESDG